MSKGILFPLFFRIKSSTRLTSSNVGTSVSIILNPKGSEFYEASKEQALAALSACPGSMMIGGGVDPLDAPSYIKAGASHVIVTSYIFTGSRIDSGKLLEMEDAVGREHLCIDLSCRRKDDGYVVVTCGGCRRKTKGY